MIVRYIRNSVQYCAILKTSNRKSYNKPLSPFRRLTRYLSKKSISNSGQSMGSTAIDGRIDETRDKAYKVCSEHLGGTWSRVSSQELTLLPISGGLSNVVFCCSLPESVEVDEGEPTQVLLRFYGQSPARTSIQLEIFNLLSQKSLGPKLYGKFEGGRIEEFLNASALTSDELTNYDISMVIAKKLAAVHCLDVPLEKGNDWLRDRLLEWVDDIKKMQQPPSFDEATCLSTRETVSELMAIEFYKEVDFILDVCEKANSPKVFSHNDLHQGNILLAKESKRRLTLNERVVLIDFEYCSYNYRAFDIANHFTEWCFEYDTSEYPHYNFREQNFPPREVQLSFVRNYIRQRDEILSQSQILVEVENSKESAEQTRKTSNGTVDIREQLDCEQSRSEEEILLDEVRPFLLAANFLWVLWGIKATENPSNNFGYWEFVVTRWKLYSKLKGAFLQTKTR